MAWEPPVAIGKLKDADHAPRESAEISEVAVFPSSLITIPDSKALNPAPLTFMMSPGVASDRSSERVAVTLKEDCPVTEELLAPIDLTPPAIFVGMFKSVNILPSLLALTVD